MSVATWFTKMPGTDLRVSLSQMLWRSQGELKMMLAKLALKIKARGLSSVLAWSCLGVSTFSGEAVSNVARKDRKNIRIAH